MATCGCGSGLCLRRLRLFRWDDWLPRQRGHRDLCRCQPLYQRERTARGRADFSISSIARPASMKQRCSKRRRTGAARASGFQCFHPGQAGATNLDIFAARVGKTARSLGLHEQRHELAVAGPVLPVADNARVSGLAVRKIGDVFSDTDGVPDWWRLAHFGHATGQAADNSRGTDDADADGTPNLNEFSPDRSAESSVGVQDYQRLRDECHRIAADLSDRNEPDLPAPTPRCARSLGNMVSRRAASRRHEWRAELDGYRRGDQRSPLLSRASAVMVPPSACHSANGDRWNKCCCEFSIAHNDALAVGLNNFNRPGGGPVDKAYLTSEH